MRSFGMESWTLVGTVALVLAIGCSERDEHATNTPPPPDSSGDYEASGTVSTTQESTIRTASGAEIQVPLYAVPETESGNDGTMVFSIERNESATPTPISGHTRASDVYRFGPDGFTFAQMVELTLPVHGDTTGMEVAINRVDPNTGRTEMLGGDYDPATKTVTAQRYHLSDHFASLYAPSDKAWGAFEVTNGTSTHWLKLCVEEYTLDYPTEDAGFDGNGWCSWAPRNTTGWNSSGEWFLPQGSYTLCVEMSTRGTVSTPPGDPESWNIQVELHQPWSRFTRASTPITISSVPGDAEDAACACTPVATTSVGTGDVQVTLTWHNPDDLDLDLFVTEPNGTKCYYGHTPTSTGGTLDRDNRCGDYTNGRPENIFWASAPTGEYKVQVDWFGSCDGTPTSQGYEVRVVAGGNVRTYSGTIATDETIDVATFTVAAGFVGQPSSVFSEYIGTSALRTTRLPKE
ncbi:MAG: hypothetical protein R3E97_22380 [Candidatus Eisenbacteria bacterium]